MNEDDLSFFNTDRKGLEESFHLLTMTRSSFSTVRAALKQGQSAAPGECRVFKEAPRVVVASGHIQREVLIFLTTGCSSFPAPTYREEHVSAKGLDESRSINGSQPFTLTGVSHLARVARPQKSDI